MSSEEEKQAHKDTQRCNKQSTAKGQNQSALIKQNAHRETLTEHDSQRYSRKDGIRAEHSMSSWKPQTKYWEKYIPQVFFLGGFVCVMLCMQLQ